MREIKFRTLIRGEWNYWWPQALPHVLEAIEYNKAPTVQYTGLKDKNGVEIYEGDIVRNYRDKLLVVAWNNGYAAFGKRDPELGLNSQPISNMHPVKQDEVIGNIYENKDLLK